MKRLLVLLGLLLSSCGVPVFAGNISSPPFNGTAANATNLAGGGVNQIPYQTGAGTTGFLPACTSGVLSYSASQVPSCSTTLPGGLSIGTSTTTPDISWYDPTLGADLKQWDFLYISSGFSLRALNDAHSAATNAYTVARGSTYNIASHSWYTSTVAGTPVLGMQLLPSGLAIGGSLTVGSSSAGTALSVNAGNSAPDFNGSGSAKAGVFAYNSSNTVIGNDLGYVIRNENGTNGAIAGLHFSQGNGAVSGSNLYPIGASIVSVSGTKVANAYTVTDLAFLTSMAAQAPAEVFRVTGAGHEETHSSTPPGVTAGTAPTIVGNDSAGRVTVGTTPSTTVALTFFAAFSNAPICFAQDETTAVTMRATTISTTGVTFTASGTLTAADKVSYSCIGYR